VALGQSGNPTVGTSGPGAAVGQGPDAVRWPGCVGGSGWGGVGPVGAGGVSGKLYRQIAPRARPRRRHPPDPSADASPPRARRGGTGGSAGPETPPAKPTPGFSPPRSRNGGVVADQRVSTARPSFTA